MTTTRHTYTAPVTYEPRVSGITFPQKISRFLRRSSREAQQKVMEFDAQMEATLLPTLLTPRGGL
jgi:hypothetical protein